MSDPAGRLCSSISCLAPCSYLLSAQETARFFDATNLARFGQRLCKKTQSQNECPIDCAYASFCTVRFNALYQLGGVHDCGDIANKHSWFPGDQAFGGSWRRASTGPYACLFSSKFQKVSCHAVPRAAWATGTTLLTASLPPASPWYQTLQ